MMMVDEWIIFVGTTAVRLLWNLYLYSYLQYILLLHVMFSIHDLA